MSHLDDIRAAIRQSDDEQAKIFEEMRQARQDARDVIRWRVATLKSLTEHDWSWMERQPVDVRNIIRECVSAIESNLDASWSEV